VDSQGSADERSGNEGAAISSEPWRQRGSLPQTTMSSTPSEGPGPGAASSGRQEEHEFGATMTDVLGSSGAAAGIMNGKAAGG